MAAVSVVMVPAVVSIPHLPALTDPRWPVRLTLLPVLAFSAVASPKTQRENNNGDQKHNQRILLASISHLHLFPVTREQVLFVFLSLSKARPVFLEENVYVSVGRGEDGNWVPYI